MSAAVEELVVGFHDLAIHSVLLEGFTVAKEEINWCDTNDIFINNHHEVCAICLDQIELQELALVKGCEHAYCVTCILQWASSINQPLCPQCKNPFEFLNVHRALDGSMHDYMFEESVCLLLRALWFIPLDAVERYGVDYEIEDYYDEEEEEEELVYYRVTPNSSLHIGNRRFGSNGFVSSGRKEARPVDDSSPSSVENDAGPSRQPKKKENVVAKELVNRRAKKALKRVAADKAAAAKHQQHLLRLGRSKQVRVLE